MKLGTADRVRDVKRTLIRRIFDSAPPDAINLGLGQPDLPTPPVIALAGVGAIAQGRTGYTATAGDPALRAALAERYAPFANGPEDVVVTVGSQEAMFAAALALVDPGDEVLIPDPGYPAYGTVCSLIGSRPVPYALRAEDGFRVKPDVIESRLTDRTRLVVLCAPSNPTGACHVRADLAEVVGLLERRGIAWISDEIYAGFLYRDDAVSPIDLGFRQGLLISGLSKDLSMTGWRIGWVIGPQEVMTKITAVHQHLVTCASSVSQRAALAAFTPEGAAARERYVERFRDRRTLMAEELAKISGIRFAMPDGAFYFFVDVSALGASTEIAARILERRKVVTIPGEAFGEAGAGYLRVSFAAGDDDIREGVRRIGAELAR